MLTSNPKMEGKLHYEPAPDGAPIGEANSARWFKETFAKVQRLAPIVRNITRFRGGADIFTASGIYHHRSEVWSH